MVVMMCVTVCACAWIYAFMHSCRIHACMHAGMYVLLLYSVCTHVRNTQHMSA